MATTAFSSAGAPPGTSGERSLPHNADAERTVLGAVLVDNQAFNSAAEILTRDDFYRDAHRRIFEAMATLAEKSEPIDLVTLKNELGRTQSLDAAGGVAYLAGLVEGVPRLENVLPWSRIIREASVLRNLIHASARIAQEANDAQDTADAILDRAEQAIFAIAERKIRAGLVPVKDFIKTTFEAIEKLSQSKDALTGVPTGFIDLDRMTSGFQKGDLIILAARPSMGKTSLALNIARTAAQATAEPVAIFSLEMSKEQLVKRLIFAEARIESGLVTRGQLRDSDWGKLTTAWADLHKLPLFIDDASFLTPLELRAKCRRLKAEHGPVSSSSTTSSSWARAAGLRTDSRKSPPSAGRSRVSPRNSKSLSSPSRSSRARPRPAPIDGLSFQTCGSRAPSSRMRTWSCSSTATTSTSPPKRIAARPNSSSRNSATAPPTR